MTLSYRLSQNIQKLNTIFSKFENKISLNVIEWSSPTYCVYKHNDFQTKPKKNIQTFCGWKKTRLIDSQQWEMGKLWKFTMVIGHISIKEKYLDKQEQHLYWNKFGIKLYLILLICTCISCPFSTYFFILSFLKSCARQLKSGQIIWHQWMNSITDQQRHLAKIYSVVHVVLWWLI